MGSELWTSPVTGYRRSGTRLAELRQHFEDAITAAAVMEPLRSCSMSADAAEVAAILSKRDFDVAGVQESPTTPVCGYVRQQDLRVGGAIRDRRRQLTPDVLIADSTPLAELLAVLKQAPFNFVMVGAEVRGIVTQADLNKPAVRMYLFGILSLVEMHINFWVRSELRDDSWTTMLPRKRVSKAQNLRRNRAKLGHNTDLLDCLTLDDKRLILESAPNVLDRLGLEPAKLPQLEVAKDIRNRLAHAYEDLAEGRTWGDIADVVSRMERLVNDSDARIEEEAAHRAGDYEDALWASA